jgi:molybdenum-dependent DNA-binding transcriptional regulator ModE
MGGGGAEITPFGHQVLTRYTALLATVDRAMDRELSRFADLLGPR